jgi:hypothetical protein
MIPQVKKLDVEVLGWRGKKNLLEVAYDIEMNIQFSGNTSGEDSCSQHANCTLPQNLRLQWHCVV